MDDVMLIMFFVLFVCFRTESTSVKVYIGQPNIPVKENNSSFSED